MEPKTCDCQKVVRDCSLEYSLPTNDFRTSSGTFIEGVIDFSTTYTTDYDRKFQGERASINSRTRKTTLALEGNFDGETTQKIDYNYHPSYLLVRSKPFEKAKEHNVVMTDYKTKDFISDTVYRDEYKKKTPYPISFKKPVNLSFGSSTENWITETRTMYVPQEYSKRDLCCRKKEDVPTFPVLSQYSIPLDQTGKSLYNDDYQRWSYKKPEFFPWMEKPKYNKPETPSNFDTSYRSDYRLHLPNICVPTPQPICTCQKKDILDKPQKETKIETENNPCAIVQKHKEEELVEKDVQEVVCDGYDPEKTREYNPININPYASEPMQLSNSHPWQEPSPITSQSDSVHTSPLLSSSSVSRSV